MTAKRVSARRAAFQVGEHVIDLAWSPDGSLLAAAAVGGPITLADGRTGVPERELLGHGFGTTALAWRPDGRALATAGQDGLARVWDPAGGAMTTTLEGGGAWVEHVAWRPDGKLLATAAGRRLRLWDSDGDLVREWAEHRSTIAAIAWTPSGRAVTAGAYGELALWEPHAAEPARRFDWKGAVLAVAWSPDGRWLATGEQDSTVHVWESKRKTPLEMWGYRTKVRELAWDANGRWLATGGGPATVVWDCSGRGPEGREPLVLGEGKAFVSAVAFQHAGDLLGHGDSEGMLSISRPGAHRRPLLRTRLESGITHLAWSPDDHDLAVGTETGTVSILRSP